MSPAELERAPLKRLQSVFLADKSAFEVWQQAKAPRSCCCCQPLRINHSHIQIRVQSITVHCGRERGGGRSRQEWEIGKDGSTVGRSRVLQIYRSCNSNLHSSGALKHWQTTLSFFFLFCFTTMLVHLIEVGFSLSNIQPGSFIFFASLWSLTFQLFLIWFY